MMHLAAAAMKHPVLSGTVGLTMAAVSSEGAAEVMSGTYTLSDIGQAFAFLCGGLASLFGAAASVINALANYRKSKPTKEEKTDDTG